MSTNRLEYFSDAVIAIIITIMVLELHIPEEAELTSLLPVLPKFLAYALSFATVGIYWNNHHHLVRAAKTVDTNIMWSNLFLLFCLSLIPFFTAWLGEHYTQSWPIASYGLILLACAFAYQILQKTIVQQNGKIARNFATDIKGMVSLASYILSVVFAFFVPTISLILFAFVAIMWFIPDSRLQEKQK